MTYHAVLKKEADRWIGWIAEMPEVRAEGPDEQSLLNVLDQSMSDASGHSSGSGNGECVIRPLPSFGQLVAPPMLSFGARFTDQGKSLDELEAAHQGYRIRDISEIFGTWPGEPNDGFEEAINELRRRDTPKVGS